MYNSENELIDDPLYKNHEKADAITKYYVIMISGRRGNQKNGIYIPSNCLEKTIARHLTKRNSIMLTTFDSMSDHSRVWIYQSDRIITSTEKQQILVETSQFLTQWAAHGSDLKAAGDIIHDHFLVISTDETLTQASGCSIDSSVHFVQGLGQKYSIDFFQRTNLAFWQDSAVRLLKMNKMKEAVTNGEVTADTLFFENTIQSKSQLQTNWRVKASETWLKRYFKAPVNV